MLKTGRAAARHTSSLYRVKVTSRYIRPITAAQPFSVLLSTKLYSSSTPAQDSANTIDFFGTESNDKLQFGDYGLIASQKESSTHKYVNVEDLGTDKGPQAGEMVWIRGRVSSVRAKGNACFLVLRSKAMYSVQALHFKVKYSPCGKIQN